MLVDGKSASSFSDARAMVKYFTDLSDVSFVVAVNRVDGEEGDGLEGIREELELPDDVSLLPVDARDRESVKAVLLALLYEILNSTE